MNDVATETPDLHAFFIPLGILALLIYGGIRVMGRDEVRRDRRCLRPWEIGFVDFFLLVWFVFMLMLFVPVALMKPLYLDGEGADVQTWNALMSALTTQLPILFAFATCYSFPLTRRLVGELVVPPVRNMRDVLRVGGLFFLAAMPLFFAVSLCWRLLIEALAYWGMPWTNEPQFFVRVLTESTSPVYTFGLVFAAVILAPLSEELIFRGILYRFFRERMGVQVAAWVSGALFAWVHLNLSAFVPLVLLGYLLARSYEKTGDIRVPIVFHAVFNAVMAGMLLLSS